MPILNDLYAGKTHVNLGVNTDHFAYKEAVRFKEALHEKLMVLLSESQKELFEKYIDASDDLEAIIRYDAFTYGTRLGTQFMAEVFVAPLGFD